MNDKKKTLLYEKCRNIITGLLIVYHMVPGNATRFGNQWERGVSAAKVLPVSRHEIKI